MNESDSLLCVFVRFVRYVNSAVIVSWKWEIERVDGGVEVWRYRLEMGLEMGLFGCLFLGEEEREKVGDEGGRGGEG